MSKHVNVPMTASAVPGLDDRVGDGTRARVLGSAMSAAAGVTLVALIVGGQDAATLETSAAAQPTGTLTAQSGTWGEDTTGQSRRAVDGHGTWRAGTDQGSTYSIAERVGAHEVWRTGDPAAPGRGLTGHGVAVALIDTGVSPLAGLESPGKLLHGPDLSRDTVGGDAAHLDAFGHGTHMAGLIAGRDADVRSGREHDPRRFVGMAPDASVVSVRVGAADGSVQASQVVDGIEWVVANRDRHDIRVLNLSYGTEPGGAGDAAALVGAVEDAWRAGIVVVVAAGNDGEAGPTPLTMPAAAPFVIAVGSTDSAGTESTEDDRVGAWTNSGTAERRPDLLAPGRSVVGLRVPGSRSDTEHPEGLVAGDRSGRLFRGTGTSQSAAVVSGAVALLLQRAPGLTPDQVKGLLVANADLLPADDSPVQGAGLLDISGAVQQVDRGPVPAYSQGLAVAEPAADEAGPGSWSAEDWSGRSWSGRSWSGRSWSAEDWSGRSWSGRSWSGRSWSADDWSGRSWSGRSWSTYVAG